MSFAREMQILASFYDIEETLSFNQRIVLYEKMLTLEDLKHFAIESIKNWLPELPEGKRRDVAQLLKTKFLPIPIFDTFFHDKQNVHILASSTTDVAKRLCDRFGDELTKTPQELKRFSGILKEIKRSEFEFDGSKLLKAIWYVVSVSIHNIEMLNRLKEELVECENVCLVGCVSRLINALRGFGLDEFETKINEYEIEKSRIFHKLSSMWDVTDPDLKKIQTIVNSHPTEFSGKFILQILNDYTGTKWQMVDGKFVF